MGNREFRVQLKDASTRTNIISAGGVCYVTSASDPAKLALKDKDGATLANPVTPTRGFINFFAADTVESVDLFIMAPGGQFVVARGVVPSGPNEILVDTGRLDHVAVIPFTEVDYPDNVETDTGFDTGTDKMWHPSPAVKVSTLDASATIDVGTDGAGSNDPDGFLDGIALDAAVVVKGTLLASGDTMGALLSVLDSANAGDDAPEGFINAANENITFTLSSGADTGKGYIYLPYRLFAY
jgi:hypothetical protein